ncbi:hypothetical protein FQA39_LY07178 [Lamprigera yunnana]|nr:hypothetical protein FQA39_LY07178 [Lamprigera yunnana]
MSHRTRLILHRALAMKANSDNDFDSDDSHVDPAYLPSSVEYISDDSVESLTDPRNEGPQKTKIWKESALETISLDNIVAEEVGAIENELLENTPAAISEPFMTEEDISDIPEASENEEVEEHNSYTVYLQDP